MRKSDQVVVVAESDSTYEKMMQMLGEEQAKKCVYRADSVNEAVSVAGYFGAEMIFANVKDVSFPELQALDEARFHPSRGRGKEDIEFIKRYIRFHYAEDLTLKRLAKVVCLSSNYLCTLFRRVVGMSIGDFIDFVRMEKAAKLLIATELKMRDISIIVGFRNPSYFCKKFRDTYGVSPRDYRSEYGITVAGEDKNG